MSTDCEGLLNDIAIKNIYNFSSEQIQSDEKHFFVVINIFEENSIHFACCTSQFEKRRKFIEGRELPFTTLVWIEPNKDNRLNKDTYIDCNTTPIKYTFDEIHTKCLNGNIQFKGAVNDSVYEQILIGLNESPLIVESYKLTLPTP